MCCLNAKLLKPPGPCYRDALGLDACDMRCLMDKVYQQKDVGLVLDFVMRLLI